nr:hypothetical protein [Mesorhizobium sp.]
MDGQSPLTSDGIVKRRRIDQILSGDIPPGEVGREQGDENERPLQPDHRMIQWLYAVGSNGLVGFVERDVVEDCLVDGAFERRRRILGRYLSELERGEAAATSEAWIYCADFNRVLVIDPSNPASARIWEATHIWPTARPRAFSSTCEGG